MSRTLIPASRGWYTDPEHPDTKVRKQEGDVVVSQEDYDAQKANSNGNGDHAARQAETQSRNAEHRTAAAASNPPLVPLSSGKVAVGKTTVIKCAWVDPDKRTKKQEKLFAGPTREITYEKVLAAAGDDKDARPHGEERTIKVQDAFQVKYCVDHQKTHRAKIRLRKNAERRAALKAQKEQRATT